MTDEWLTCDGLWKWISLLSELLLILRNVIDSVRNKEIANYILQKQPLGLVASLFIQSSGEKAREQGPEDENLKKTSSTRPWGPLLLLTNNTSQGPIQVYPVPGRDYPRIYQAVKEFIHFSSLAYRRYSPSTLSLGISIITRSD